MYHDGPTGLTMLLLLSVNRCCHHHHQHHHGVGDNLHGKDVIYSQDLGYSILGLRILNPGNFVLGLRFKDPES